MSPAEFEVLEQLTERAIRAHFGDAVQPILGLLGLPEKVQILAQILAVKANHDKNPTIN